MMPRPLGQASRQIRRRFGLPGRGLAWPPHRRRPLADSCIPRPDRPVSRPIHHYISKTYASTALGFVTLMSTTSALFEAAQVS
jgi:hypothetical protein